MIAKIHIEQLELKARIGVTEEERGVPQRLVCNATFVPIARALHDEIANTIDYAVVAERVQAHVSRRAHRLLETLADEIAGELLREFPARSVAVELRKFVLAETEFVSVTAVRKNK